MIRIIVSIGLLAGVAGCHPGPSAPLVPAPLLWDADDSLSATTLRAHGRRMASVHAVVYAPVDLLPAARQAGIVDSVNRGVAELRRLIGAPLAWERIGSRPIEYYLVPDSIISHAGGDAAVFISVYRALNGTAPYLHEASHQLLAPPPPFFDSEYPDSAESEAVSAAWPLWLTEGVPDVLAQMAASSQGLHEGDVFRVGGLAKADSTCVARLEGNPWRNDILRVIGGRGMVEALFTTDRRKVAPTFYACAQSMTKFLVDTIGLEPTVAIFPAIKTGQWAEAIERSAGVSLSTLQARWRARLGLAP